jgi:hypothetical protein
MILCIFRLSSSKHQAQHFLTTDSLGTIMETTPILKVTIELVSLNTTPLIRGADAV